MHYIALLSYFFQLDEVTRLTFLNQAQKRLVAACDHLLKKSALKNDIIKSCTCLQPEERKKAHSVKRIADLARALPIDIDIDLLQGEWRLSQYEKDELKSVRVDQYWSQFFDLKNSQNETKYPNVARVVKLALCLLHGNAEVERGFSDSARYLTDDRALMSERTLNAAMTVKSGMKKYFNKPQFVPANKELLNLSRNACSSYKTYLEDEKKRKKEEIEKNEADRIKKAKEEELKEKMNKERSNITNDEKKLVELKKNHNSKRKIEEKLSSEANKKLKIGLEKKSLTEIEVAQALFQGVTKVRKEADKQQKTLDSVEKEVSKKKTKLITEFFKK